MIHKVPTLKQVRQAALQGRAEEAVHALRLYAERGNPAASASLAELLAFRREWEECLKRAGEFIVKPQSVYAGNVFDDMIHLMGCAGRETGQWPLVQDLRLAAENCLERNIAEFLPAKQEALRIRYRRMFQVLDVYAQREGTPPQEVIPVFEAAGPTQAERDVAYRLAVQNVFQLRPDLRKKPSDLASHYFGLVRAFYQEAEGLRLCEEGKMPANFDCAVFVAKAYVRQGAAAEAWKVLWKHTSHWRPVDPAQVAPVVLLIDKDLASLMNPQRCEQVLALPRGSAASHID